MRRISSAIKAALTASVALLGSPAGAQVRPTEHQALTERDAPKLRIERHLETLGGDRLRVQWQGERPTVITGLSVSVKGSTPLEQAADFLDVHEVLTAGTTLVPVEANTRRERTVVRLAQHHQRLPVLDHEGTLTLDDQGHVIAFHNAAEPLQSFKQATITEDDARTLALRYVLGEGPVSPEASAPKVTRGVAAVGNFGVEVFEVEVVRQPMVAHFVVRVDGHSGRVIGLRNRVIR
ncbi:MAG: hypothetical protein ACE366_00460 [Bradymonadia bacterium]